MATRFSFGGMFVLMLAAYLPILGCDAKPAPPPAGGGTATEDHDHADADHDHDHDQAQGHADHDHEHAEVDHAHPETYAAAVTELDKLCAAIEAASAKDELSKADDEVHEIGHLLEDVGALAGKEPLGDDAKAKIGAAIEELMDAFEQVDAKIHGGEGKAYSAVADKINAAMSVLKDHVTEEK